MSEKNPILNNNIFELNIGIFKTLDYDLDWVERKINFMKYDYVLCEDCNQKMESSKLICYNCYNKETDYYERNRMNNGICKLCFKSNAFRFDCCKIFKTSDYNLNLEERKAKYKNYTSILCEKCNQEIDKEGYYCSNCCDKETNINVQNHMKYGTNFGIFKTSDYYLNLEERKAKYKNYTSILCEKCNQEIDKEGYYCTNCYIKETDINKRNYMGYGMGFGIFKKLDYNLNLEEREAKYEYYSPILCEKCNQKIDKDHYYCTDCYNKETDINKRNHMKYGTNFVIFKTSDYVLDYSQRKAKYKGYDSILCEECNREIIKQICYCSYCYNKKNDINKKNKMVGKCKVCFNKHGNCCSSFEFRQFLEDFDKWVSEISNNYSDIPRVGISDYDLDEDDRRVKYKDYDYILCEKCSNKIYYYCCFDCYNKETEEIKGLLLKLQDYENFYSKLYDKKTRELRELKELQSILKDYENLYFNLDHNLGIFEQITQKFENIKNQIESKKILVKNIKYSGIHECDLKFRSYCDCYDKETDSSEKKRMKFGKCKECFKINENLDDDCLLCKPKHFENDFVNWTSGNETIDKSIQENQLPVRTHGLLEWIPYDKFTNIKYIAEGGFAKVYSAIWIDGRIKKWSQLSNSWRREGPITIALKVLKNSENISEDFLNEINCFKKVSNQMCIVKCFGITQDPNTRNYALVLQYIENGDLRSYLKRTANFITWDQRINKIYDVCLALNNIHIHGLIHKDLHPGNIFVDSTFTYIGDFGLCMPANEISSNSTTKSIYGVMPYMAPEILNGNPHTLASDIYSLGIIINEIITVIPPFNNQPHDGKLAVEICCGKRPNIREETPDSLKELIEKCWDAIPEERPTTKEILHTLSDQLYAYKSIPLKRLSYNFNESIKIRLDELNETHPQSFYTSRFFSFHNLPQPKNCSNRQKFISSRKIMKTQTGKVNKYSSF